MAERLNSCRVIVFQGIAGPRGFYMSKRDRFGGRGQIMSILDDNVPANWPSDAKTLVYDLRRVIKARERDLERHLAKNWQDVNAGLDTQSDDEIARECVTMRLTKQEATVWRAFRDRLGKFVTNEHLLSCMYINDIDRSGCAKITDVVVCKLRRALKKSGLPYVIQTKFGVGKRVLHTSDVVKVVQKIEAKQHPLLDAKIGAFVSASDIETLCWAAGLSGRQLAFALNVRPGEVHRWICGHGQMPVEMGVRIAKHIKKLQADLARQGQPRMLTTPHAAQDQIAA